MQVAAAILEHMRRGMRSELCNDEIEPDLLRVIPILFECPAFDRPDKEWGDRIIREMALTLIWMHRKAKRNIDVLGKNKSKVA